VKNTPLDPRVARMRAEVERHLMEIADLFVTGTKLTFIARHPLDTERDVLISNDSIEEIVRGVQRAGQRETS
jgi:hypothetical protein